MNAFAAPPLHAGERTTLLVVEDHSMLRESLADYLALRFPGVRLQEACSLKEACEASQSRAPDLIVLDLSLQDASGLTALTTLRRQCPDSRIVVLSGSIDPAAEPHLKASGAQAFVPKSGRRDELASVIQTQLAETAKGLRRHLPPTSTRDRLTPQQTVLLDHLLQGRGNKEIASRTGLSHGTVRNYVSDLLQIFHVDSRAQLLALFRR